MYADNFLHRNVRLFGRNPSASSTVWENCSGISEQIYFDDFGAAEKIQLASTSALDTANGTGVQTVLVCGLDENYKFLLEVIALAGTTPVTSVNKFLRVFSIEAMRVGALHLNQGDLHVIQLGGATWSSGSPSTLARAWVKMLIGYGVGTSAIFTAPIDRHYVIKRISIASITQVTICIHKPWLAEENAFKQAYLYGIGSGGSATVDAPEPIGTVYPPKTDFYLRCLSNAQPPGAITALAFLTKCAPSE